MPKVDGSGIGVDDTTEDDGHPQPNPKAWPECPNCGTAWVLRRCMSFSMNAEPSLDGYQWLWQRDCKCKGKPAPVVGGSPDA